MLDVATNVLWLDSAASHESFHWWYTFFTLGCYSLDGSIFNKSKLFHFKNWLRNSEMPCSSR